MTEGNTLTGIDPKTNAVVLDRHSISAEGIPTGLAAGFGSVWIGLIQGHVLRVLEVGPEVGNVRRPILLEEERSRLRVHSFVTLTVGEDAVWALERGLAQVTRIDPAYGDTPSCSRRAYGAALSIAVDGDAVWLGGRDGM